MEIPVAMAILVAVATAVHPPPTAGGTACVKIPLLDKSLSRYFGKGIMGPKARLGERFFCAGQGLP